MNNGTPMASIGDRQGRMQLDDYFGNQSTNFASRIAA